MKDDSKLMRENVKENLIFLCLIQRKWMKMRGHMFSPSPPKINLPLGRKREEMRYK